MSATCPFCQIVAGNAPTTIVREWPDALAIVPLGPVVEGHTLVVPKEHVTDFVDDPVVSAQTMYRAAELCDDFGSYNVITSRGRWATQSVFHLHLHVVPRKADDGLALPWYSGRSKRRTSPATEGATRA
jgi:histidine triad (HIT) family protein